VGDRDLFDTARSVADAVLYEGYVLYPYRASSRKNQVRFQWGVLMPRDYSESDGSERWRSVTECLLQPDGDSVLHVRLRFLQTQRRLVEQASGRDFESVPQLEVDGVAHLGWDEAVEHVIDLPPLLVAQSTGENVQRFVVAGGTEVELIVAPSGEAVGRFVRTKQPLEGQVTVTLSPTEPPSEYRKVAVEVANTTVTTACGMRDDAICHSLVGMHTMVAVTSGKFISLLDPPDEATAATAQCHSDGSYPVLIGNEDNVVLASPIILYDHPEVAEQSPGDLYDSLEIDEILALRVMTLTEGEKAEARATDPRAASIIDRCDAMSPETLGSLHGQMRMVEPTGEEPAVPWWDPAVDSAVDPWSDSVWIGTAEVRKGAAVRLRPSQRSDAQDMFLDGQVATVAGVFTDVDGETHVAVTLDDDPATLEFAWQGRYLFFQPDEVEPLMDMGSMP
jgi:hypothetical protein